MTKLLKQSQSIERETLETDHRGRPLVIEITRYGIYVRPKGSRTPDERQLISVRGAWEASQTRAARIPTHTLGMTKKRKPKEWRT